MLPYFRKSETDLTFGADDFHGGDGPIPVRRYKKEEMLPVPQRFWETCVAAGYSEAPDQNHPDAEGVSPSSAEQRGRRADEHELSPTCRWPVTGLT